MDEPLRLKRWNEDTAIDVDFKIVSWEKLFLHPITETENQEFLRSRKVSSSCEFWGGILKIRLGTKTRSTVYPTPTQPTRLPHFSLQQPAVPASMTQLANALNLHLV